MGRRRIYVIRGFESGPGPIANAVRWLYLGILNRKDGEMRRKLPEEIRTSLTQKSDAKVVRLSCTLRAQDAEAFLRLHEALGGPDTVSRNDLASRILAHTIVREQPVRAGRKEGEARSAE